MEQLLPIQLDENGQPIFTGNVTYNDISDNFKQGNINQQQAIDLSNARLKQDYRDADLGFVKDSLGNGLRATIGGGLQAASFHPIFNIPYVGTGLGGAIFNWGDSINKGDSAIDTLKNMDKGFLVGETIGAIPYAGKGINMLSGGRIGNFIDNGVAKLGQTPIGQKASEYASGLGDILMTDINNKWIKGYHGTPNKFDKFDFDMIGTTTDSGVFGNGMYFTKYPEIAKHYAGANGEIKNVYLDFKKPLILNNEEQVNKINQVVNKRLPEPTIEEIRNGTDLKNYSNEFRKTVLDEGYDSIINNIGRDGDEYIAFSPEQIKHSNIFDYLKNDSVLTKNYAKNKEIIDSGVSKLYNYIKPKFPSLKHYENPTSDFRLPDLNINDLQLLGKENKPVIIKQNIVDKNKNNHPELNLSEYNNIIENGLYNAKQILQTEPVKKPNYYNFVSPRNGYNDHVLIELNLNKNNYEIVGWHIISNKGLKAKIKTANKNGGQSIITDR